MAIEILPFEEAHLDAAAELLAQQVRTARRETPEFSERFEDAAEARKPLAFTYKLPMFGGVAAMHEGETAGFMLGLAFPDDISHYALAPFLAVAESHPDRREVLREMYASLAASWVEAGCVGHYPSVPACEPELLDAWYSLGFGQDNVKGIRSTEGPPTEAPDGVEIRRATPDDVASIQGLYDEMVQHLAGTATFAPPRPEPWAERRNLAPSLAGEAGKSPAVYFLALRGGKAIGVQHVDPTERGRPYMPEDCVEVQHAVTASGERGSGVASALLSMCLAWAREAGYERCVVEWETTNLQADRFWTGHGLRPISYLLARLLAVRPQ